MTEDIVLTVSGPYLECAECHHPGPPETPLAVTFTQPTGARIFYLIPHRRGCSAPNPFNGPSATIAINGRL